MSECTVEYHKAQVAAGSKVCPECLGRLSIELPSRAPASPGSGDLSALLDAHGRWSIIRSSFDEEQDGTTGSYSRCRECGRITSGGGPALHRKNCGVPAARRAVEEYVRGVERERGTWEAVAKGNQQAAEDNLVLANGFRRERDEARARAEALAEVLRKVKARGENVAGYEVEAALFDMTYAAKSALASLAASTPEGDPA